MKLQRRSVPIVVTVALLALFALVTVLYGAVRIGGSSFAVNGVPTRDHQYTGACPVDLTFDWGVISTEPAVINYWTSRNDGAESGMKSIDHPGGRSIPIMEHWRLGANKPQFANFQGWMQINIESPNPASMKIPFTLHCR